MEMRHPINLSVPYQPHAGLIASFEKCPLIAILRGITAVDAADHGRALYEAGFRIVEVPLNSPQPFDSIEAIRRALPDDAIVGAGTVLRPNLVNDVKAAGGDLIVMPHSDAEIVLAAKALGLACAPGVATLNEAFLALKNGADVLKVFPAEQLGAHVIKAWRAVIAKEIPLVPVGGIAPENMGPLLSAGANGFGLGSALYKPGQCASVTASLAKAHVEGLHSAGR
jgi:2-dehydro-3-deoxyphosphogalactonate aldolase